MSFWRTLGCVKPLDMDGELVKNNTVEVPFLRGLELQEERKTAAGPRGRRTSETTRFQCEDSIRVIGAWVLLEGKRRHGPSEASDTQTWLLSPFHTLTSSVFKACADNRLVRYHSIHKTDDHCSD